jgi:hypothetical protein
MNQLSCAFMRGDFVRKSCFVERQRAIQSGMDFIYRVACDPQHFEEYGSDLLSCFYFIASTSQDASLRSLARKMGRERARQWRHDHPSLPPDADADTILDFLYGSFAAGLLRIPDSVLKQQIRHAVGRFTVHDYLCFDPITEPPPSDVPEMCDCGVNNARGRTTCRKCKKRLTIMSRYEVWCYALMITYNTDRFGVRAGARYGDVIKWLPSMRPYRGNEKGTNPDFIDTVYSITHLVYTLNDYSVYKLSPRWLHQEFEFLKANLQEAIAMKDPEMVGEFLDCLKSFGLKDSNKLIRMGIDYLLSRQNSDGSWGDVEAEDIYQVYHPTWTAIDGLRDYAWRGEGLSFPRLKPLLERWAKTKG